MLPVQGHRLHKAAADRSSDKAKLLSKPFLSITVPRKRCGNTSRQRRHTVQAFPGVLGFLPLYVPTHLGQKLLTTAVASGGSYYLAAGAISHVNSLWVTTICALCVTVGALSYNLMANLSEVFNLERRQMPAVKGQVLYGVDVSASRFFSEPRVLAAVEFAADAHRGQFRKTGEPYVSHCIETAMIVEHNLPHSPDDERYVTAMVAAVLHDVIDDTDVSLTSIQKAFGPVVAGMVAKVSKLSQMNQLLRRNKRKGWAEYGPKHYKSLRKMIVDMVFEEPLVILIKLADRLHNMRTVYVLAPDKQRAVSEETREVWCSMAECLGWDVLKSEMEDLCFAVLEPEKYCTLRCELDRNWNLPTLKVVEQKAVTSSATAVLATALASSKPAVAAAAAPIMAAAMQDADGIGLRIMDVAPAMQCDLVSWRMDTQSGKVQVKSVATDASRAASSAQAQAKASSSNSSSGSSMAPSSASSASSASSGSSSLSSLAEPTVASAAWLAAQELVNSHPSGSASSSSSSFSGSNASSRSSSSRSSGATPSTAAPAAADEQVELEYGDGYRRSFARQLEHLQRLKSHAEAGPGPSSSALESGSGSKHTSTGPLGKTDAAQHDAAAAGPTHAARAQPLPGVAVGASAVPSSLARPAADAVVLGLQSDPATSRAFAAAMLNKTPPQAAASSAHAVQIPSSSAQPSGSRRGPSAGLRGSGTVGSSSGSTPTSTAQPTSAHTAFGGIDAASGRISAAVASAMEKAAVAVTGPKPFEATPQQQSLKAMLSTVVPFDAVSFNNTRRLAVSTRKGLEVLDECAGVLYNEIMMRSQAAGLSIHIQGRLKSLNSVYRKMVRKNVSVRQVYDARALRVIVDDDGGTRMQEAVDACYRLVSAVHSIWKPIKNEFDDYVANPKPSGYQALHTAVKGPGGIPMEVQIKSSSMHELAEYGFAAHWVYKEYTPLVGTPQRRQRGGAGGDGEAAFSSVPVSLAPGYVGQPLLKVANNKLRYGVVVASEMGGKRLMCAIKAGSPFTAYPTRVPDYEFYRSILNYTNAKGWTVAGHGDFTLRLEQYVKCDDGRFHRKDHLGVNQPAETITLLEGYEEDCLHPISTASIEQELLHHTVQLAVTAGSTVEQRVPVTAAARSASSISLATSSGGGSGGAGGSLGNLRIIGAASSYADSSVVGAGGGGDGNSLDQDPAVVAAASAGHDPVQERFRQQMMQTFLRTQQLRSMIEWGRDTIGKFGNEAEASDEVSVLIWPGGRIQHYPRGTTVGDIVQREGEGVVGFSGEGRDGYKVDLPLNVNNRLVPESTVIADGDLVILSRETMKI